MVRLLQPAPPVLPLRLLSLPPPPANAREPPASLLAAVPISLNQIDARAGVRRPFGPAVLLLCGARIESRPDDGIGLGRRLRRSAGHRQRKRAAFFRDRFDWVGVGNGKAFATGYYEPEIAGSRTPPPGYRVPIYGGPADLIRCTTPDGRHGRGRIDETGACVLLLHPCGDRGRGACQQGLEIAWAADPVDLFFLEIQGSGRAPASRRQRHAHRLCRSERPRIRRHRRLLRDRGVFRRRRRTCRRSRTGSAPIRNRGAELMRENLSYIFFKELTGPGPLGALNVPVTPHGTVAADPNFVPLGAPVFPRAGPSARPTASGSRRTPAAQSRARTASTPSGARGPEATRPPAECRLRGGD